MRGVRIVDGTTDGDFLQSPVEGTVGVTPGQLAEVAGDEDLFTALRVRVERTRVTASVTSSEAARTVCLVQVDVEAKRQAAVSFARAGEFDVDVGEQLSLDVRAAVDTDLGRTRNSHAQMAVSVGRARRREERGRGEENLFHVFPHIPVKAPRENSPQAR